MWNNYGEPARYHGLMPTVNYGPEEKTAEQIRVHYFCNLNIPNTTHLAQGTSK